MNTLSQNTKPIRVLSLFDGMSCGQQALERISVKVAEYYASEIDKHAITVTQSNYPNTVQIGSVVEVDIYSLPKIDLLMGGSPCQSFSFAGKRKGMSTKDEIEILTLDHYLFLKKEGYEFEGQSYLFWEFMRLLHEVKPTYFLLENVKMGEKWEKILSKAVGVKPIEINSSLVSAQNRKRLYWTNIGMQPMGLFGDMESIIPQPKDKRILLKDILENEVNQKYYLSDKAYKYITDTVRLQKKFTVIDGEKSSCLMEGYSSNDGQFIRSDEQFLKIGKDGKVKNNQDKASFLTVGGNSGGNHSDMDLIVYNAIEFASLKFGRTEDCKIIRKQNLKKGKDFSPYRSKELNGLDFEKMNTLTSSANKDNLVIQINASKESNGKQPYQQNRIYDENGISPALNVDSRSPMVFAQKSNLVQIGHISDNKYNSQAGRIYTDKGKFVTLSALGGGFGGKSGLYQMNNRIRRLTPTECERLQTVKDGYTKAVSDTQRYRMLGNGWTVDVIAHILKFAKF